VLFPHPIRFRRHTRRLAAHPGLLSHRSDLPRPPLSFRSVFPKLRSVIVRPLYSPLITLYESNSCIVLKASFSQHPASPLSSLQTLPRDRITHRSTAPFRSSISHPQLLSRKPESRPEGRKETLLFSPGRAMSFQSHLPESPKEPEQPPFPV